MHSHNLSILITIFLITVLIILRIADPAAVKSVREELFDTYQTLSPREFTELPVRIVDIDERALSQFGQWPWPRHTLASLTKAISDAGAAVIVFDFLFAEPDRMSPSALLQDENGIVTGWDVAENRIDRNRVWINEEECIRCGACVKACPVDAITLHKVTLVTEPKP